MNQEVRFFFIELAIMKRTVVSLDLGSNSNLKIVMQGNVYTSTEFGNVNGCSLTFYFNNKPSMISSFVLRNGSIYQGDGIYKLIETLGFKIWKKFKNDSGYRIRYMKTDYDFGGDELNYCRWK